LLDDRTVRVVKLLIVVGIVASLVHFADNALEIGRYPEPAWIAPGIVLLAWIRDAAVATAALLRIKGDLVFMMLAAIFGVLLLTGLAHYSYGSPIYMTVLSNFTIVFEAMAGIALLAVLSWSLVRRAKSAL
jgi:hypothetical protein